MKYVLPMVAIAALIVAYPAVGGETSQDIDDKIAEIDAKMDEWAQLKDDLVAMRDDMMAATEDDDKADWEDNLKVNGYFQMRARASDFATDDFFFKQMYINLWFTPNDRTKAMIQWTRVGGDAHATANADFGDVWVEHKVTDTLTARMGQSNNNFGLEMNQSSSQRLPLERAAFLQGNGGTATGATGAYKGLYFGGLWDRGLWLTYTPQTTKWDPKVTLGIMNGQFRAGDTNGNKTVLLKAHWNHDWGQFGATWLDGKVTSSPTTDRNAILGYVRWAPADCKWAAQAEYVDGELLGADIDGWYGQVEYAPVPEGTAFARYEQYDPMTATPGNEWDAWHLGYAQWIDPYNELTIEYTDGTNEGDLTQCSREEIALQWQLGFR